MKCVMGSLTVEQNFHNSIKGVITSSFDDSLLGHYAFVFVCRYVRLEEIGSHSMDFPEI